jgi:hypothetical protein
MLGTKAEHHTIGAWGQLNADGASCQRDRRESLNALGLSLMMQISLNSFLVLDLLGSERQRQREQPEAAEKYP